MPHPGAYDAEAEDITFRIAEDAHDTVDRLPVIGKNPMTGKQVWNKQRKDEVLIDVNDVGLGHETKMRWNDQDKWIRSDQPVHEPLIDVTLFEQAQAIRHAKGAADERSPRRTRHPYALRGLLRRGVCGRRMQGSWNNGMPSQGHRVVGIDASQTMARLTAGQGSLVVLGDAAWLPLADGAVDLVVAYMCLHDIDDVPRAMAEASRVLQPSGRLCLAIPHPVNTAGAFAQREPGAPFVISGSYLDPAPLRSVVERGGIKLTFHSEHRPIETYMRALEAAGLLTEALREVRTPDEVAALDPAGRRWQRIPLFLHLRAIKPA